MANTTNAAATPSPAPAASTAAVTGAWSFAWAVISSPKSFVTLIALIGAWCAGHFDIGAGLIGTASKSALLAELTGAKQATAQALKDKETAEAEAAAVKANPPAPQIVEKVVEKVVTAPAPAPKAKPAPKPQAVAKEGCSGVLSCLAEGKL